MNNKKQLKLCNIRKITVLFLIAIMFFTLISSFRSNAAGDTFIITNAEVVEKSDTVNVKELSAEKTQIDSSIIYHKVGDYIKYNIILKNNDNTDYKITSVTDNNTNEFISYDYTDFQGTALKANGSADLYVTVKYLKELEDISKRTQEINAIINVTLEDDAGNVKKEDIAVNNSSNDKKEATIANKVAGDKPNTGDSISLYFYTAIISAIAIIVLLFLKHKKARKGIGICAVLLIPALLYPGGGS